MIHPGDQPDFDLDEDLFDFAGVARDSDAEEPEEDLEEIFASFRDAPAAEELLAVPSAPGAPPLAPAAAPTPPVVAPAPAPAASVPPPAPRPAGAPPRRTVEEPQKGEPRAEEPVLAPAARSARFSRGVLAIALSVTVLNSVLAVVMMRGRSEGEPLRTEQAAAHEPLALAAPPHAKTADLPDPEAVEPVHSHPALDEARAEISRGEYAAARQRVYGLLAIIDRLEDPRRGALEADCQFLIAQSLHLEALARMGGAQ